MLFPPSGLESAKDWADSRSAHLNPTTEPFSRRGVTREERQFEQGQSDFISVAGGGVKPANSNFRLIPGGLPNQDSPGVSVETKARVAGHNVATITVSNAAKLNIVNRTILQQLGEACHGLSKDQNLRAVVLTGGRPARGKAASFIGGADITEMRQLSSADEARAFILRIHEACNALRALPVPVIAQIHGFSLGAGLEIMAACDLRVATKDSAFGMPEVKIGIPSVVEAALLPGLIGLGRTRRLLYLAETIGAGTAERWGLVEEVVSDEVELDRVVDDWVSRIVSMGPEAMKAQKLLMRKWENCTVDEGIAAGVDAFAAAFENGGSEAKEFMGRFIDRKR